MCQLIEAKWSTISSVNKAIISTDYASAPSTTLQWRHIRRSGVSNHQPHDCLLKLLFRRRSKKTSKLRVTGLCVGNSPMTGEFTAQRASNAENGSIWWRHHNLNQCWPSVNWMFGNKYHSNLKHNATIFKQPFSYAKSAVLASLCKLKYRGKMIIYFR